MKHPSHQMAFGRLANNSNLAAKGMVALEAFSHLCEVHVLSYEFEMIGYEV